MVRRRALITQRAAGKASVSVVGGYLLVSCPSATEVVLEGMSSRRGELGLRGCGPLVVLDDTVLSGNGPLLSRVGLRLRL